MNSQYLASYSSENSMLIIRDFVKGLPVISITNFDRLLGLNISNRSQYSIGYEIGDMILPKDDPNILITSESKKIRVWDLREALTRGTSSCVIDPGPADFKSRAYTI